MERATDQSFSNQVKAQLASVRTTIQLLRTLLIEEATTITGDEFRQVLHSFRYWASHVAEDHQVARDEEKQLLQDLVNSTQVDPLTLLEVLTPWDPSTGYFEAHNKLTDLLLAQVYPRVANAVLGVFDRPSGVSGALGRQGIACRYMLFSAEHMWTAERTHLLAQRLSEPTEAQAENSRQFLRLLFNDASHGRLWQENGALGLLKTNEELLRTLWKCAVAFAVNSRFFSETEKLRDQIEENFDEPLALPSWWDRITQEAGGGELNTPSHQTAMISAPTKD